MHKLPVTFVAAVVGVALLAGPAFAQTATDVFGVSITIENECTIDVTDLSFGTVGDLTPSIAAVYSSSTGVSV